MEKKIYNQPVLKVVAVKKNIIATSLGDGRLGAQVQNDNDANIFVGERRGWDEY